MQFIKESALSPTPTKWYELWNADNLYLKSNTLHHHRSDCVSYDGKRMIFISQLNFHSLIWSKQREKNKKMRNFVEPIQFLQLMNQFFVHSLYRWHSVEIHWNFFRRFEWVCFWHSLYKSHAIYGIRIRQSWARSL